MPKKTYPSLENDRPLVWLGDEVKSPPLSKWARIETGFLLRCLQRGQKLSLPQSRPMPAIGPGCHELRINDENASFRIVYRIDADAIVIADVFRKASTRTPESAIQRCRERLSRYDRNKAGES